MKKTAVLLIGFGGPQKPEEVKPFLASVVGGMKIPEERLAEVLRHYVAIGGISPFNAATRRQKDALEILLRSKGVPLPVGTAYRHSTPSFKDAFESYKRFGVERVIGFVLTSFRSSASFRKYAEKVEEGRKEARADSIRVEYTRPFADDERYLEAQVARIQEVWGSWGTREKEATEVIFTAHSIPVPVCEESCRENGGRCYGSQFHEAARRLSRSVGAERWSVAYQSRSGNPRDPWLEPDVQEVIRRLDPSAARGVLLVPVGFLCDNVEVIYDLDHAARSAAQERGLKYFRAGTVGDHPLFIEMMADLVLEKNSRVVIK